MATNLIRYELISCDFDLVGSPMFINSTGILGVNPYDFPRRAPAHEEQIRYHDEEHR